MPVGRRYHHLDEDFGLLSESDVLPYPVVVSCVDGGSVPFPPLMLQTPPEAHNHDMHRRQADLNGDGRPEVIIATHDAKLQVRLSIGADRMLHQ